jgi:hypothetical protein
MRGAARALGVFRAEASCSSSVCRRARQRRAGALTPVARRQLDEEARFSGVARAGGMGAARSAADDAARDEATFGGGGGGGSGRAAPLGRGGLGMRLQGLQQGLQGLALKPPEPEARRPASGTLCGGPRQRLHRPASLRGRLC